MNPQGDYQYYSNNQMKDMNSGQGTLNKHNKKNPYKNFKNDLGKNNPNNMDEKFNMQNSEHNQNFQHMRGGMNKKNYRTYQKNQSEDFNSGFNPNYKKKKNKKRDNNNNDFQYANNSNQNMNNSQIDINQNKEEHYDQQNNNQNNHQQIYNKQYKKNQNNVFNPSNNTTNSNNSNSASTNLTPNRQNPMVTPYGFNSNLANSPANLNFNFNNANHGNNQSMGGANMMSPQTAQKNPNIYMNPNLVYMSGMPQTINMSENENDSSIKDEKSSENLSEEAALSQASLQGRNTQNQQSDLQKINPQNEYVNPILINNKFMRQPNYLGMPYNMNNMNNIPNMGNINNLNNINDLNNFSAMNNLNNNMNMNANNLGNIGNLNMNNFTMQQLYEHQNNPLVNAAALAGIPNYQMTEELAMNQKKMKKSINKSPMEQTHSLNASINLGMLPNLNYNGPNNKFIKTNNGLQGLNKNSISLQGNKNTIPNFNQSDNLNFVFSQNKMQQPDISSLMNPITNRTFYVQQNAKNFHNNANNMSASSHLMNPNTNPLAAANNKNSMFMNKDFINNNVYNNNNNPNNKKFQKQMNYNNNNNQQNNNLNNNNNNKNNQYNENNNNNILKSANSNKSNNNNIKDLPKTNSIQNLGEAQLKQNALKIRLKLDNEEFDMIEIKSKEDSRLALKDIKVKKNINEKIIMLLQEKIKEAFDVTKNILNLKLDKYTVKNFIEINRILNIRPEKELENFGLGLDGDVIKRNKSFDGKNDRKNLLDYKSRESLNLSC